MAPTQKPEEVLDNATLGRLQTKVAEFDAQTLKDQDRNYLRASIYREAYGNLRSYSEAVQKEHELMVAARRDKTMKLFALEDTINQLNNKAELVDKLQDAATYTLAAVAFWPATGTAAIVLGTTTMVVSWANDAARAESASSVLDPLNNNDALEYTTKAGDVVGEVANVSGELAEAAAEAARAAGQIPAQLPGSALPTSLGVLGAAVDVAQAATNSPEVVRLNDQTTNGFNELRQQIDGQSWFASSERTSATIASYEAEHAQQAYNRAVSRYNAVLRKYAHALAVAKNLSQVTYSEPR